MSKLNVTFFYIWRVCFYFQNFKSKTNYLYVLTFFKTLNQYNPFVEKPADKHYLRYWLFQNEAEVIAMADKLFEENKYIEVYELLNRQKFNNSVEIKWRIARSLFFLLDQGNVNDNIKKNMISEAKDILQTTIPAGEENANIHKWMAIIINYTSGLEGLENRIKAYPQVKDHLMRAASINPNDFCVYYMLGKLCFEMSNMSRIQQLIAKYLYEEAPQSSYEEAYEYLVKAEELQPRCFIPNMYFLGKACIQLKMFYRAKYYLELVINLPANDKSQKRYASKAKQIIEKLEKYDLGKDVLFCNYLNDFGFTDDT